jgi:hypothetical protein
LLRKGAPDDFQFGLAIHLELSAASLALPHAHLFDDPRATPNASAL